MSYGFSITVNCSDGTEHDILPFKQADLTLVGEAIKSYFDYPDVTSLVVVITRELGHD